jgi:UDP-N-acetylglucosamine--N-acetylmuramyl-(pentapeptide) pyrophosphoryl-undecaprenol N-acetylglucosamine transferase
MGGYASAPGGFSAWLLRKPLILHEQNASAGLSNRCLSKVATKVLSAFPGAFKSTVNYQVVGNPLRADIINIDGENTDKPVAAHKKVLVVGGSLGAQVLNETVPSALEKMKLQTIDVWHQSGAGKQENVVQAYKDSVLDKVKVTEFIDDMASAYQWADIVICRAGALTVSELAMAGKPAIFVPLPHAVDDHQTKNALYLVDKGAAILMHQRDFNAMTLVQTLNSLFGCASTLMTMAKNAKSAAHPDATVKVSEIINDAVKR